MSMTPRLVPKLGSREIETPRKSTGHGHFYLFIIDNDNSNSLRRRGTSLILFFFVGVRWRMIDTLVPIT